jgi:hypothetical protein
MKKTYSDAYQDIFTLKLFNNQKGFYLDIGCSDGISKNNTYLLECNGWKGISIDNRISEIEQFRLNRKDPCYLVDATEKTLILNILEKENSPKSIDYLSLDIDDSSLACLLNFPHYKYRFKFLTFEHDIYAGRQDCIDRKKQAPPFLESLGYIRIVDNVSLDGLLYEDWFIDPIYFDIKRFKNIINESNLSYQDIFERLL